MPNEITPKVVINEEDFTIQEREIMRLLYKVKVPMTAYEITNRIKDITLPTTKIYVKKLYDKSIIEETISQRDSKTRYFFNFKLFRINPPKNNKIE
jgi:predicted transcriptional regulator